MAPPLIDMVGHRAGRLTVLRRDTSKTGNTYWHCKCDCGNEASVAGHNLRTLTSRLCGCLNLERVAAMGRANKRHGMYARLGILAALEMTDEQ